MKKNIYYGFRWLYVNLLGVTTFFLYRGSISVQDNNLKWILLITSAMMATHWIAFTCRDGVKFAVESGDLDEIS